MKYKFSSGTRKGFRGICARCGVQFVLAGKGQDQPCPHCGFKNDRVAAMTRVKVKEE